MLSAKRFPWIVMIVIILYLGSVVVRGMIRENEAEEYLRESLLDIAIPWSESKISHRASVWLKDKSPLKPDEIVRLASEELGSLIEIQDGPDCRLETGFDSYSNREHTYALCAVKVRFENKSVNMDMRLIEEGEAWKINNFISIE